MQCCSDSQADSKVGGGVTSSALSPAGCDGLKSRRPDLAGAGAGAGAGPLTGTVTRLQPPPPGPVQAGPGWTD